MEPGDYETIAFKLRKRGFKLDDPLPHECWSCHERAVARWVLLSRLGGRDIDLCRACGAERSYTRRALAEERDEDEGFDVTAFLR